jgi:hypothetical protein
MYITKHSELNWVYEEFRRPFFGFDYFVDIISFSMTLLLNYSLTERFCTEHGFSKLTLFREKSMFVMLQLH